MAVYKPVKGDPKKALHPLGNSSSMKNVIRAFEKVAETTKGKNVDWSPIKKPFENFGFTIVFDRNLVILITAVFVAGALDTETQKLGAKVLGQKVKSSKRKGEMVDLGQTLLDGDGKAIYAILNTQNFKQMLKHMGIDDKYINKFLSRIKKITPWRLPGSTNTVKEVKTLLTAMTGKEYKLEEEAAAEAEKTAKAAKAAEAAEAAAITEEAEEVQTEEHLAKMKQLVSDTQRVTDSLLQTVQSKIQQVTSAIAENERFITDAQQYGDMKPGIKEEAKMKLGQAEKDQKAVNQMQEELTQLLNRLNTTAAEKETEKSVLSLKEKATDLATKAIDILDTITKTTKEIEQLLMSGSEEMLKKRIQEIVNNAKAANAEARTAYNKAEKPDQIEIKIKEALDKTIGQIGKNNPDDAAELTKGKGGLIAGLTSMFNTILSKAKGVVEDSNKQLDDVLKAASDTAAEKDLANRLAGVQEKADLVSISATNAQTILNKMLVIKTNILEILGIPLKEIVNVLTDISKGLSNLSSQEPTLAVQNLDSAIGRINEEYIPLLKNIESERKKQKEETGFWSTAKAIGKSIISVFSSGVGGSVLLIVDENSAEAVGRLSEKLEALESINKLLGEAPKGSLGNMQKISDVVTNVVTALIDGTALQLQIKVNDIRAKLAGYVQKNTNKELEDLKNDAQKLQQRELSQLDVWSLVGKILRIPKDKSVPILPKEEENIKDHIDKLQNTAKEVLELVTQTSECVKETQNWEKNAGQTAKQEAKQARDKLKSLGIEERLKELRNLAFELKV